MILNKQFKLLEKLVADNAPTILTGIGVVGTAATAYLTGKATFKAAEILATQKRNEEFLGREQTSKDAIKLVWKEYLPPVSTGTLTIAAIVTANRVSTRRAAAMAAAYTISERAYSDYKEKITEKLGIKKEKEARDELSQDRVTKNPPGIMVIGSGDVLCFDTPTGRYFKNNMENLRRIQNEFNQSIIHDCFATLHDLYILLELSPTPFSEEIGWDQDNLLEFDFSHAISTDNQPCITIDYSPQPIRGYKSRFLND